MTIRIEDLKAGMKVKFVEMDTKYRYLDGFVSSMEKYLGKVYTIRGFHDSRFTIEEDKSEFGGWYWNVELIEKIIEHKEEIKIEDLKAGMKVRLVDEEPNYHVAGCFTHGMREFLGKVYTVKRIADSWDDAFYIEEDTTNYVWDVRLVAEIIQEEESPKEEIKIEELKVGMKIKLVNEKPNYHIAGGFNAKMGQYLGKTCTITKVYKDGWFGDTVEIEEDGGRFIWDLRLIESVRPAKMVYKHVSDMVKGHKAADKLTLMEVYDDYKINSLSFEKCIINDRCVIVFLKNETGVYKGVAKCCDDDVFDIFKGFEIALLKANKKYLDKKLKDACR